MWVTETVHKGAVQPAVTPFACLARVTRPAPLRQDKKPRNTDRGCSLLLYTSAGSALQPHGKKLWFHGCLPTARSQRWHFVTCIYFLLAFHGTWLLVYFFYVSLYFILQYFLLWQLYFYSITLYCFSFYFVLQLFATAVSLWIHKASWILKSWIFNCAHFLVVYRPGVKREVEVGNER